MTPWLPIAGAGAIVGAAGAVLLGRKREAARLAALVRRLREGGPAQGRVDFGAFDALPEPVRRYLRYVLTDGQPMIRAGVFRQSGQLRTSVEAARWSAFTAEHIVVPPATGFVWCARIETPLATHVRVLDSYVAGIGAGHVSLLSAFPIASETGLPELNAGELHRYLAEAVWYPTALLPQTGVAWTAIDGGSATATLAAESTTVSLVFRFNEIGEVTGIYTPGRFGRFDGGYRQVPWEGHFGNYRETEGMRVPLYGEVGWYGMGEPRGEPRGELRLVWKGEIVELGYEFGD